MLNILAFNTLDVSDFLIFGVPNVKYLAFDTSDGNVLIKKKCLVYKSPIYFILFFIGFKKKKIILFYFLL